MFSPAPSVKSPANGTLEDLARMESYYGYVDATKLLDSLLEILDWLLPKVIQSVESDRRLLKQAHYLASLMPDLQSIRAIGEALPIEAVKDLKLICTWKKHSINTLKQATTITTALNADKDSNEYSETAYLEAQRSVSESLCAFAMATSKEQGSYVHLAEARSRARTKILEQPPKSRVTRRTKHRSTPEDYPKFVRIDLYDNLRKYTRCQCQLSGEATGIEHEAKLCLRRQVDLSQDLVNFDLHFWSLPYWDRMKEDCHWQQLRLHVPSKRRGLKQARVQDIDADTVVPLVMLPKNSVSRGRSEALQIADVPIPSDEFCTLLSESIGPAKMRLRLHESTFLRIHEVIDIDQDLVKEPSVSLAQVLSQHCLDTQMKISLAYTLARSVWQYYDSDWMGSGWTSNTIHFMLERSDNPSHSYIDVRKPCLTVRFQNTTDMMPEYDGTRNVIHPHPRVVALGVLLVNIASTPYNEDIAAVAQTHACKANEELAKGRRAFKNQNWPDFGIADAARQRLRTDYKAATKSCFDKMIFQDIQSSVSSPNGDGQVEELRSILYERVVCPLEEIIADMDWTHSLDDIQKIEFRKVTTPEGYIHYQPKSALLDKKVSQFATLKRNDFVNRVQQVPPRVSPACFNAGVFDDDLPSDGHTSTGCHAYQEWKAGFSRVYEHFIEEDLSQSVSPIKIAILDTGLDMNHECIEAHAETLPNRVSGRNWLNETMSKDLRYSNGHGTHIAGIILDLIPHSELLVAKVTDGVVLDPRTLAKAIDHAVDEKVDIISISMGFPQKVSGYYELERAMKRAYFADVLIFAAASNGGGNKGRAYPARDKHVFCIHATDAWGNGSGFSPTPERNAYNFATVGEAVESFWSKHLCNPDEAAVKIKSGTSFATPIAASIAAFLLLYARVNLATEPEIAKRLKGYQAMESLLSEVCQSSRPKTDRDGYQYLFLSRYPDSFFGEDRDGEEINNRFRRCI